MKISDSILFLLALIPVILSILLVIIALIGNHTILRAGGTSAHENYPKVMASLTTYFLFTLGGFAVFFLAILGYLPSDAVVTLISVIVGAVGAIKLKQM